MKKLKIGLVLDDSLDTPDGVQQYVLAIGGWLASHGHEVHYLVGETHRTDVANVHSLSKNVKVQFNGNNMSVPRPASRRKLRGLLAREQFDVLHVQMPYSPLLAGRIVKAAPKSTAIVATFHILPLTRFVTFANRLLALVTRRSLKRFGRIFATSKAAGKFADQVYRTDSQVLPNVVDVQRFRSAKPLPEFADDKLTIMFLGRLVPRKGCMTLLEAVRILKQRNHLPPFRVVVCGKGPLDAELKQYAADQLLDELVTFAGFIPEEDKPSYVASADIMTFPSTGGESFGIVLIEAMAGDAVTLAGDNPGYRSVLEPRPELLFPADDAFELAKRLSTYLRDADARAEVLAWQRQYVRQFDVDVVGKKLVETYMQLLQDKR
jgi:phosphatidyl-myo-inositol alpha-mannosyltransferase